MYSLEDLGVVKDMDYSVPAAINNSGIRERARLIKGRRHVPSTTITLRNSWKMPAASTAADSVLAPRDIVVGDTFTVGPNGTSKPRCHVQRRSRDGPRGFARPGVQPSKWH